MNEKLNRDSWRYIGKNHTITIFRIYIKKKRRAFTPRKNKRRKT